MAVLGLAARVLMRAAPFAPHAGIAATVLNVADQVLGLRKIAHNLGVIARRGEDQIGEAIVVLARQRSPDDTGRLDRGTVWRRVGDQIEIVASAAREVGGEDYAWFVERGTVHMDASPFFWDSAREVLERYGRQIEADIDAMADDFNTGE